MKLIKYRVTNFRSVRDSGWLEAEGVTALIGVNESGKTNLLLPLWKLNPARDGEIQPTSDYPKTMFGEIRDAPGEYPFISAEFDAADVAENIAKIAKVAVTEAQRIQVTRFFDGSHKILFPENKKLAGKPTSEILHRLQSLAAEIEASKSKALRQEEGLSEKIVEGVQATVASLPDGASLDGAQLSAVHAAVASLVPDAPAKTSVIVPLVQRFTEEILNEIARINAPDPGELEGVVETVVNLLPKFVYYSNYGNLDSEIYLPQVVENLQREDLGTKEAAKARTLRVLFQFVRLQPVEILQLGRDFRDTNGAKPTQAQLEEIVEAKKTRSILLQSAGSTLTEKFRNWWKQGDYRFRFEADGNHFRIWVADSRRPQEVELENRSTGLQWFLSFYLVFLVESLGEHKEAILLLDEPGLSLHPLAQRDLSEFFDNLAQTNQIIYTSHSPFLVDADRLERARKVYVASDGSTKVTADLRHVEGNDGQAGAAYAVYSALNLSVAESLLLGCQPVIVEGPSDQLYLTTIKSLLLSSQKISPKRELVFPPSGGTKTARAVASMLSGRDEKLPVVLLDADASGKRMARELASGLYVEEKNKILSIGDFVNFEEAEIEDLFPVKFLADEIDRIEREPDTRLADVIQEGKPFVGQVEAWSAEQGVELKPHWKVELAKRAKQRALTLGIKHFDAPVVDRWVLLFNAFAIGEA